MGSDNEMAVVLYKGQWYIGCVWGGNWQQAVLEKQKYSTLADALVAASDSNTEYGIRVYKHTLDLDIIAYLEENYPFATDRFWANDLKECNAREAELQQMLNVHKLQIRKDSKLCRAYISGGLEEVRKLNDTIQSLKDIVLITLEMDFLYSKTNYPTLIRQHPKDIERMKRKAVLQFAQSHSIGDVPELLKPHYQSCF